MLCEGCSTQPWLYLHFVTWDQKASLATRRVLSPLLSSCLVNVISVEAFLLLFLLIDLECIYSNMAQVERVKGMETQVASSEGERVKEQQMDLADQHLVLQLGLVTGICLLWPQDPLWQLSTARGRLHPPDKVEKKHLCQKPGQSAEKSFILGTLEKWDYNP